MSIIKTVTILFLLLILLNIQAV